MDITQNYGSAFYSCAVGMGLGATCLALVGPSKSGICQGRRKAAGSNVEAPGEVGLPLETPGQDEPPVAV